ncbi:MAG TPA: damage-inducible protein DinB [Gammaproteobacteria bacterium]|jgi:uncharacterized damage-inducible protein DinB|nr:damage-inducible protein DinB [Gammaproteobacteria bacterium]
MLLQSLRLSAAYNQWVNARLYAVCADLDEADYRRDLGAFFKSIHGTLNHVLLTDRLWLSRIGVETPVSLPLNAELYADFVQLRTQRECTDGAIQAAVGALTARDLDRDVRYVSVMTGREMRMSLWAVWVHLFNHQTHHRGQLTALLSRLGMNYGDIDLVWMPGVARIGETVVPPGAGS